MRFFCRFARRGTSQLVTFVNVASRLLAGFRVPNFTRTWRISISCSGCSRGVGLWASLAAYGPIARVKAKASRYHVSLAYKYWNSNHVFEIVWKCQFLTPIDESEVKHWMVQAFQGFHQSIRKTLLIGDCILDFFASDEIRCWMLCRYFIVPQVHLTSHTPPMASTRTGFGNSGPISGKHQGLCDGIGWVLPKVLLLLSTKWRSSWQSICTFMFRDVSCSLNLARAKIANDFFCDGRLKCSYSRGVIRFACKEGDVVAALSAVSSHFEALFRSRSTREEITK